MLASSPFQFLFNKIHFIRRIKNFKHFSHFLLSRPVLDFDDVLFRKKKKSLKKISEPELRPGGK